MIPILKTAFTERKRISDERLTICNSCEHYIKKTTKCEKCGCFMEYKTLFLNSECPIGKWNSINDK